MQYVGIDLHEKESQICLLTEAGDLVESHIRTESQCFAEGLGGRPRARILVEDSTESEWGRWLLVQAAVSILRLRGPRTTALRQWATGIA